MAPRTGTGSTGCGSTGRSEDPARFWDELEIRLLRSEAEAVVRYDPVFPDDSFAR
jgi:hypothetical protein